MKKLFTVCGYVLHQAYVVQLDNYGPMKRDRTILVFVRLAESHIFRTPACPWLPKGDGTHTLETFQCLAQDDLLDPALRINDFHRKVLSDPELAKVATSKQAWNARLINPSEKLPTIQHLYVESINMNRKTLLEHGLHCPVLNGIRVTLGGSAGHDAPSVERPSVRGSHRMETFGQFRVTPSMCGRTLCSRTCLKQVD